GHRAGASGHPAVDRPHRPRRGGPSFRGDALRLRARRRRTGLSCRAQPVTASDLLRALGPVIEALEELGVAHYVGGSLASSVHGIPRTSIDADVIADLGLEQVAALAERLRDRYYLDERRIRAAVEARRSFNLIHLDTMVQIDVFV